MKPNKKSFLYIGFMFLLSLAFYKYIFHNYGPVNLKDIAFWGILAIVVESLLVILPNNDVGISVGSAINIATVLAGGPFLATSTSIISFLFRFPNVPGHGHTHLFNTPYFVTIFNVSQASLISSLMGLIYIHTGGIVGQFYLLQTIWILLGGIIINTITMSILISLNMNKKFTNVWISYIKEVVPSSLAVGTLGVIIYLAFIGYGYGAVILFFGPLLLARHSFKLYIDMRNLYMSTIETLSKTIEAKDPYTSGHANRVEEYSVKLAEACGLSFEKIQNIRKAAILHDIGKIGISDNILHKACKLTEEEIAEIRKHPVVGAEILNRMDFLGEVSKIVRYHHERYDGKGYPEGLKGDDVPLEAYILGIADAYDAMTTNRPYRRAMDKKFAIKEIRENAGNQFHPMLAEKFVSIISK